MKAKKQMSLTAKELFTNGITGIIFILCGVVIAVNESAVELPPIVKWSVIALAMGMLILRIIVNHTVTYDVWDETAKLHYEKARKIIFNFLHGFLLGAGITMLFCEVAEIWPELSFKISAGYFLIFYGIMNLATAITFIVLEKRDA